MKKILLIGFLLVILIAIPLTMYLLSTQTKTNSKAAKSTTLTFSTLNGPVNVGQNFNLNVLLDPGQNQVSFVKLILTYDSTKLKRGNPGISPNTSVFPVTLEGPTYDQCTGSTCTESITLSIGTEVTKAIQGGGSPVTIASINFQAVAATDTTPISFGNGTQVLSLASADQPSENVLSTSTPATITVAGPTTPTEAPPGDATIAPTTDQVTTTPSAGANQNPLCTSLIADNVSSASAPFTVLFTANGNDPDGVINKVTYNFGDGSVQEATSSGNLGTNTVNPQVSYTYQTTGMFTANATFTDDQGAISDPTTCSLTISIGSAALSATPTQPPAEMKKLPPTGPGQTLLIIGAAGAAAAAIGGALLFGL